MANGGNFINESTFQEWCRGFEKGCMVFGQSYQELGCEVDDDNNRRFNQCKL